MPIKSATCETSFSAMRKIKKWLGTSILKEIFNTFSFFNNIH